MFELKPDYEISKQRLDAFWEGEIIDRPVVQFGLSKPPEEQVPLPVSHHTTPAERWLDTQYQAELVLANLQNTYFLADTMPVAWPNLGPEVMAAFYGCPLHFGDYGTSWSEPILRCWDDAQNIQMNWEHPYLNKLLEMTETYLEIGQGKFITGMPDWHPGGDLLAALREPQNLAIDLLDHKSEVKRLLTRLQPDYYQLYDLFYTKLRQAGQPISFWMNLVCDGKFYAPSNDFSIMISNSLFRELFLPGLANECRFLDHSLYHLDGIGALRHLDSLLEIHELDAIQFVPGSGNEGFHNFVPIYRKIQAAKKGIFVICNISDIELVIETLDPRGLYLWVDGLPGIEAVPPMLSKLEKWCVGKLHQGY